MAWITTEDTWLTEAQSLKNAQLVADYFIDKGWTPNAIAALCGNMRHESSINPNIYEFGYGHSLERGYGLVQWTPATKYIDWANANGYDFEDGNSQLARIDYEQQQGIQWITTSDYPLSFNEFTQSELDVSYLTKAFTWNYERPNRSAGEESTPDRIAFAQKVLSQLGFEGGGGGVTPSPSKPDRKNTIPITQYEYETEGTLENMTYYKVKKGDTLNQIAVKNNVPMETIKQVTYKEIANKGLIEVGQILLLPKATKVTTPRPAIIYTVKKGDTLSAIAKKYNTSIATLMKKNTIKNANKITIGQKINI